MRNRKSLLQLACLIGACALAVIAKTPQSTPAAPEQPIPFSHKLHAGAQQLKCATCHKNPDPGEKMGLPVADTCMQCHSDVKTDSPAIQKLASFAKEKKEVKWARVYEIPSYVFFNHRIHLNSKNTCADCHGQVKELERMYRAADISMASCVNCHQAKGASIDCNFCHEKM